MLAHHRGGNREMKSGHAPFLERLWIQLSFDGRRVSDDAQPRAAGKKAQVPRLLLCRRAMNELDRITFHEAVGVADSELMLIDQQTVRRWFALKKGDCSFDSPDPSDERAGQEGDDAEMGDEKSDVMFLPGPARKRGNGEIGGEEKQPRVEPRRAVDVGAGHFRVEAGFVKRAGDCAEDQHRQQDDGEFERGEKAE